MTHKMQKNQLVKIQSNIIRKISRDYLTFMEYVNIIKHDGNKYYKRNDLHFLYDRIINSGLSQNTSRGKSNFTISLLFDKIPSGKYVPNPWFRAIMIKGNYKDLVLELLEFAYRDKSPKYRKSALDKRIRVETYATLIYIYTQRQRDPNIHRKELSNIMRKYKAVGYIKYLENNAVRWHKFAQLDDFDLEDRYYKNFDYLIKEIKYYRNI